MTITLVQFDQGTLGSGNDAKSCAASALLVALNELGKADKLTKVLAMAIYLEVQKSNLEVSPVGKVTAYALKKGLKVAVYENTKLIWTLKGHSSELKAEHDAFVKDMQKHNITPVQTMSYKKDVFDGDARVMLVVFFDTVDDKNQAVKAGHYVLARRISGTNYSIMNPDGGVETAIAEATLLTFMNTPGKGERIKIGGNKTVDYTYAGISVQLKK